MTDEKKTVQIDAGGNWTINNAAGCWQAVNTRTGEVLGPFSSWQEAAKAVAAKDKPNV